VEVCSSTGDLKPGIKQMKIAQNKEEAQKLILQQYLKNGNLDPIQYQEKLNDL
jgi:hypothetical protein